ncbi:UNKNOWN [Stylonychia lemnae]|uniref:Amino acid transporter transmembrane domain-containing protein n=1 Tax=Stylonychia lemnae TaxID=5949 RepID=A0A077ZUC0_STYLE|nr:UNKNOWN [Stylonychia lemnae]|eukprot:CDW73503.1 UNKNOWN [Stylonychia lemnae]
MSHFIIKEDEQEHDEQIHSIGQVADPSIEIQFDRESVLENQTRLSQWTYKQSDREQDGQYEDVGVLGGSIGMIIIAALTFYAMLLQIYVKEKLGQNYTNLPDIAYKLFGQIGKNYLDFLFTIMALFNFDSTPILLYQQSSMKQPELFKVVLGRIILGVLATVITFGTICYLVMLIPIILCCLPIYRVMEI